ncbi:2-amino-4-hydroxy-6-hydroxymethyldihydropteridine diphosphokinase [Bacillota bacterium LX-D]|nr:2-amino-4-hydroxy-6-hydroxymethyldihydropteridine diphosphokinase [Bacillota bacterium LX-D]
MAVAFIGLGSNLGDKQANIKRAIEMLNGHEEVDVTKISPNYETEPVGYAEQDNFFNAVVAVETSLTPLKLLELCLNIEQELKRVRKIKWGPRTIDLDILLYDDLIIKTEQLTVPHPYLHERWFALKPLNDLAPNLIHPVLGESVSELLAELEQQND